MESTSSQVSEAMSRLGKVRRPVVWAAGVSMVAVVVSPAAASWTGLVGFSHALLGLYGPMALVVPVSLNGAALYSAVMTLVATLAGRLPVAARFRRLVNLYVAASAGFNIVHALSSIEAGGGVPAAAFYAVADLSAALLWHTTITLLRADVLSEIGALEAELPRFRAQRWMVAPFSTFTAWRTAVLEGITSPAAALERRAEIKAEKKDRGRGSTPSPRAIKQPAEPVPALAEPDGVRAGDEPVSPVSTDEGGSDGARRISGDERRNGQEAASAAGSGSGAVPGDQPAGRVGGLGQRGSGLVEARSGSGRDVRQGPVQLARPTSHVVIDHLVELGADLPRAAFDEAYAHEIKQMVPAAVRWAAEHGHGEINRSSGYDALRRTLVQLRSADEHSNVVDLARSGR